MKRALYLLSALALVTCKPGGPAPRVPVGASLLYDVSFSAPEQKAGEPVHVPPDDQKVVLPLRIPSRVFMGAPTVTERACGLGEQPLQLSLVDPALPMGKQLEGVQFDLDAGFERYHAELDACVAMLQPARIMTQLVQLLIFVDVPDAYAIGFLDGGKIGLTDPMRPESQAAPKLIGGFIVGQPRHFAIDVDVPKKEWRVAIDGSEVYSGAIQALYGSALRVVLRGGSQNVAAIDNVLIWAEGRIAEPAPNESDSGEPGPVTPSQP
jgi:hypothetical protein